MFPLVTLEKIGIPDPTFGLVNIEPILNTVVYSVYSNAKYYHVSKVCGNQTNARELTVRKALQEGLEPCPDCNPPVPDGM